MPPCFPTLKSFYIHQCCQIDFDFFAHDVAYKVRFHRSVSTNLQRRDNGGLCAHGQAALRCGVDRVGGGAEHAFDLAAQERQNGDNNQSDQGDQKSVFNEGLALFFLQKLFHHGGVHFL